MRFPRPVVWLKILLVCLGLALLISAACVIPGPPVRGHGVADPADVMNLCDEEAYARVQQASLEKNDGYTLAFLEFDSSGRPGEGQVARATQSIHRAPGRDAVVVLFVHGWGHSADARDPHVIEFRKTLSTLARKLPRRSVVGIYVSWRAKWLKGPLFFLTFWDRSIVAQRLGGEDCGVRCELGKLRRAVEERKRRGRVASVAIGHSLGGQLLFSYTEECLDRDPDETCDLSRDECQPDSPPRALPLFGDLVLLVNPAQDTHDFEKDFRRYAREHPGARPVVVILSSEADKVMGGGTYRIGRTIRNLWPKYWDSSFIAETIGLGWDDRQVTHALCPSKKGSSAEPACRVAKSRRPTLCRDYGTTALWSRADCARPGPFMLVRVDGRLVTDHGDMFNTPFAAFLRQFVAGVAEAPAGGS